VYDAMVDVIEINPIKNVFVEGNVKCYINGQLVNDDHNTWIIYGANRLKYMLVGGTVYNFISRIRATDELDVGMFDVNVSTFSSSVSTDSTYSDAIVTFSASHTPSSSITVKNLYARDSVSQDNYLFQYTFTSPIQVSAGWTISINWTVRVRLSVSQAVWDSGATSFVEAFCKTWSYTIDRLVAYSGDTSRGGADSFSRTASTGVSPVTMTFSCVGTFSTGYSQSSVDNIRLCYNTAIPLIKFNVSTYSKNTDESVQVNVTFTVT
jgi:hypothetical protein